MGDSNMTALAFAVAGGVANGTFPVFIKTKRVRAAQVHPVVFQLYKSSWVAIFGVAFVLVRLAQGQSVELTPWAAASAAAWIPSGVFTITAVPLIGVGSAVLVTAATGSALSFLVFWLGFHESIKVHDFGGEQIVLAPYYMLGCLAGMGGLVAAQQLSSPEASIATPHVRHDGLVQGSSVPVSDAPACSVARKP